MSEHGNMCTGFRIEEFRTEPDRRTWWRKLWGSLRWWWLQFRIRRGWFKIKFPIVRQQRLGLSADDIVSVQPMTGKREK